jgi:translation initiation factor 1
MSNTRLVWSDDPKDKKCAKCGEFQAQCRCEPTVEASKSKYVVVFRLEKNGRGGKTVTVLDQLPKDKIFLEALCKELKNKCGTGGKVDTSKKEGIIEIQGDKRVQIKAILDAKGIKHKGM